MCVCSCNARISYNFMYIMLTLFLWLIQLNRDMNTAIEGCNSLTRSGQDLPTKLKIASISTRYNNLNHEGDKLLLVCVNKPVDSSAPRRGSKGKVKRTESASASELAIKQTLASLQNTFSSYKKAFERRQVSLRTAYSVSSAQPDRPGTSSRSGVLLRTKSELKSPSPIETSPSHNRPTATENHLGSMRARAYTDNRMETRSSGGDEGTRNAVKDKVTSFNKKAREKEQIQMPNFGITFDVRPRAKTADSTIKSSSPRSPRRIGQRQAPIGEKMVRDGETKVEGESPEEATSVPLRRKGRGLSKDERRQKIAAIRELFETSDLANIMVEPGRQWRPASLSSVSRRTLDGAKRSSGDTLASEATQSPNLKSDNGASLSNGGNVAKSSLDSVDLKSKGVTESGKPDIVEEIETEKDESRKCEQAMSPSVVVSPPPEIRPRLQTAPAVYKTTVKDLSSTKQQVITLNFEHPKEAAPSKLELSKTGVKDETCSVVVLTSKGGSLDRNSSPLTPFVRDTRATRSVSPQQRRRMEHGHQEPSSQQSSPGRARHLPLLLQVEGKVSSLRSMFDSQAALSKTTSSLTRSKSNSESKSHRMKPSSPRTLSSEGPFHQRSSSMDTDILKRSAYIMPSSVQKESQTPPAASDASHRSGKQSPDIVPLVRPEPFRPTQPHMQKESPLRSSITESSSPHPPPRPHSPVGYLLENQDQSESDLESESDGSIFESDTSSLDEVDLEWVGGEDEVDLPWGLDDPDLSLAEQRIFKTLR